MWICTLAGGLWFHKTMKRLCLSMLIPSMTDVILIIYFFYLRHSAIIQRKLTEVRNSLYFSISEHFRQEKTSEWLLLVEDTEIGILSFACNMIFSETKSRCNMLFPQRQACWHIDWSVASVACFIFCDAEFGTLNAYY